MSSQLHVRTARRRRAVVGGLCLAAALATLPGVASADDVVDQQRKVTQQLSATQDDLDGANQAVAAAGATLRLVGSRLPAAQATLDAARGQLEGARAADAAAAHQLSEAQLAYRVAAAQEQAADARLQAKRDLIGDIARAAYERGRLGGIVMMLDATGPNDLMERSALLRWTAAQTNEVLLEVANERAALAAVQADMAARQDEVARLRQAKADALARTTALYQAAASAEASVQGLLDSRRRAYAVAAQYRADTLRRIAELKRESDKLAAILRSRGNGGQRIGKGGLLWPADGPVTSGFGYRKDPFYGTYSLHAGVDIGAPYGATISAAAAGTVVYAGQESGYGNYTCIDHGGGFATCYAHQSYIGVHVGEHVVQGQHIGRVGSTGASTGPHLHFETRINGNPVDPMQYF